MILKDRQKMSKSKGNTVSLDDYDGDEIRFYLMFIGHYFDGGSWSDQNLSGVQKFIKRFKLWMSKTGTETLDFKSFESVILKHTENFKFNKVVSEYMTLLNKHKDKSLNVETKTQLINLLEIYMPDIKSKLNETCSNS